MSKQNVDIFYLDKNKAKSITKDEFTKKSFPYDTVRVNQIKSHQKKEEHLYSKYYLYLLLTEKYQLPVDKLEFKLNQYGKPFLEADTKLEFNISHSGDYIFYAFHSLPIGIDIQKVESENKIISLAKKICSHQELNQLNQLDQTSKKSDFLNQRWVIKESITKFLGKGLIYPFNKINISNLDLNNISKVQVDGQIINYYIKKFQENYYFSIAANKLTRIPENYFPIH